MDVHSGGGMGIPGYSWRCHAYVLAGGRGGETRSHETLPQKHVIYYYLRLPSIRLLISLYNSIKPNNRRENGAYTEVTLGGGLALARWNKIVRICYKYHAFLWQIANECNSVASERTSEPSELTSEALELNSDRHLRTHF